MFNILLDRLPDSYKGYLIRTDFRTGIKISQAADDEELTGQERSAVMLTLLYGSGIPQDPDVAVDGLKWYLRGGDESVPKSTGSSRNAFDFDFDHARLWSGFRRVYGIDLSTAHMHWFQFLALMSDLDGSAFSEIVGYRLADTSKMAKEMRAAYHKMQDTYAITEPPTEVEQSDSDEFMRRYNGCEATGNSV